MEKPNFAGNDVFKKDQGSDRKPDASASFGGPNLGVLGVNNNDTSVGASFVSVNQLKKNDDVGFESGRNRLASIGSKPDLKPSGISKER